MKEITSENYFEAAYALHWYCANYHKGQWSAKYELLCRLNYKPALSENCAGDVSDEANEFYELLVDEQIDAEDFYNQLVKFLEKGE